MRPKHSPFINETQLAKNCRKENSLLDIYAMRASYAFALVRITTTTWTLHVSLGGGESPGKLRSHFAIAKEQPKVQATDSTGVMMNSDDGDAFRD